MGRLIGEAPLVWVTRARPAAEETARRLEAIGHTALVDPVLEARAFGDGPIDLAGAAALAFTSANAVAAFRARSPERGLPVFAVGGATAAAARTAGFEDIGEADGDVATLARRIADDPRRPSSILHLAAREPAGDLVGELRALGVKADGLAVYETLVRSPMAATRAALTDLAAILLHSPKAASVVAAAVGDGPLGRTRILCLSPAIGRTFVAALPPRSPVAAYIPEAAALPNETALLSLLRR
ncbi:MAG: uroporphyrinogen-III synthase [Caulobacteraceae bacterium]